MHPAVDVRELVEDLVDRVHPFLHEHDAEPEECLQRQMLQAPDFRCCGGVQSVMKGPETDAVSGLNRRRRRTAVVNLEAQREPELAVDLVDEAVAGGPEPPQQRCGPQGVGLRRVGLDALLEVGKHMLEQNRQLHLTDVTQENRRYALHSAQECGLGLRRRPWVSELVGGSPAHRL